MFDTTLLAAALILAAGTFAVWRYRAPILDSLCGTTPAAPAEQIKEALDNQALLLDVRMYVETRKQDADLIPGAKNVPLLRLRSHLAELPRDRTIITFCVSGKRAGKAADMLNDRGFSALSGGGLSNVQSVLAATNCPSNPRTEVNRPVESSNPMRLSQ